MKRIFVLLLTLIVIIGTITITTGCVDANASEEYVETNEINGKEIPGLYGYQYDKETNRYIADFSLTWKMKSNVSLRKKENIEGTTVLSVITDDVTIEKEYTVTWVSLFKELEDIETHKFEVSIPDSFYNVEFIVDSDINTNDEAFMWLKSKIENEKLSIDPLVQKDDNWDKLDIITVMTRTQKYTIGNCGKTMSFVLKDDAIE